MVSSGSEVGWGHATGNQREPEGTRANEQGRLAVSVQSMQDPVEVCPFTVETNLNFVKLGHVPFYLRYHIT